MGDHLSFASPGAGEPIQVLYTTADLNDQTAKRSGVPSYTTKYTLGYMDAEDIDFFNWRSVVELRIGELIGEETANIPTPKDTGKWNRMPFGTIGNPAGEEGLRNPHEGWSPIPNRFDDNQPPPESIPLEAMQSTDFDKFILARIRGNAEMHMYSLDSTDARALALEGQSVHDGDTDDLETYISDEDIEEEGMYIDGYSGWEGVQMEEEHINEEGFQEPIDIESYPGSFDIPSRSISRIQISHSQSDSLPRPWPPLSGDRDFDVFPQGDSDYLPEGSNWGE
ncbi:hypothetical protein ABW20_dc0103554 [Dactylellina cionopaga]|nr:hypothetical protein ABW20_dc0103554 [Dactylellina cionopaga]